MYFVSFDYEQIYNDFAILFSAKGDGVVNDAF